MPVGHSQSMSVRISTQTLFGRSNHMPQFCGGKTLRPNVIWRHAMTSFQATLTTEPPFSETPWRPGEYALRDAWFPVAHTPTLSNCALHRTVHSQPYFLWRDDGIVRANNNHPGAPHKRPPSKFTDALGNYPVVNRYGHIWVWYGDPHHRSEEHTSELQSLMRISSAVL